MPKVALTTLGCKVNQFETEVIEGLFVKQGYQVTGFDQHADIYIINTCSVTHIGEKKSRQLIRRANRLNPDATIVVTGCYAQISPDDVAAIPGVDVVIGTQDRQHIVELVERAMNSRLPVEVVTNIMQADKFEDIPLFSKPGRTRAFLKIQEGCTNYCTYCIIPYTRGPLRSRPLASVVAETAKLLTAGFQEIVLTGIHLGAYGRDLADKLQLVDVVKALLKLEGLARIRLSSIESIEVSAELIDLMRTDPRVCPHLHLPLQSGSDRVLSRMNRHYTTDEYRRLVTSIQSAVPDIAISTDIILGFPGETSEMFEESMRFVSTMNFARMHVFPYSRRSGTPAADFAEQVPEEEKRQRAHLMQNLAEQKADVFRRNFCGQVMDVLFESEMNGIADGLTGNYLRVYTDGGQEIIGNLKQVRLARVYKDGLWGTLVT